MSSNRRSTSCVLPGIALMAILACGCSARAPKDAKPVVGPPPSRTSMTNSGGTVTEAELLAARTRPESKEVEQVGYEERLPALDIDDTDTIAYVNGEPILAGEVLEPYLPRLEAVKEQVPAEELRKQRIRLLEHDLPRYVDKRILVQAFLLTISTDQKKQLDAGLERLYSAYVENMMHAAGVNSEFELDAVLRKDHSSLAIFKSSFRDDVLAKEFLNSKLPKIPKPSRADLVRYYNEHLQEFSIPAKVRWEQIEISYNRYREGKAGAKKVLALAAEELLNGVEFAEVAKKYSDGPGADQGGFWDWTEEGTLKDKTIERALFTEPVGQISDAFEGKSSYQVVRVVERQPAGYVPFPDVQDKIKDQLKTVKLEDTKKKILSDLRANASVQTIFDVDGVSSSKMADPFQPLMGPSPRRGPYPQGRRGRRMMY